MRQVTVISRHAISNYGSFLQALALQMSLEKLGYQTSTIDYIHRDERPLRLCEIRLKNSRWNRNPLRRLVYHAIHLPDYWLQYLVFQRFRRRALHLSVLYDRFESLALQPPPGDIFCTGSDQVWNETLNGRLDWSYFLDFLPDCRPRISYAASFGNDTVRENDRDHIRVSLQKFSSLGVREDIGCRILMEMGLSSTQVLDPTLLVTAAEWRAAAHRATISTRPYVLLYQIHPEGPLLEYARRYARLHGYTVISVNVSYTRKRWGIRLVHLPSYGKLLALIDGAVCVMTDSFHATAFSINLQKRFVTFLPRHATGRNMSLLRLFGLESRAITDLADLQAPDNPIDYAAVDKTLQSERARSLAWLSNALDEALIAPPADPEQPDI